MSSITEIQHGQKIVKKTKRLGRGVGSGKGGKSGRGQKGQKSRTGSRILAQFEGGQTSFVMKIPKLKGFKPLKKEYHELVNLDRLDKAFEDGATVDVPAMVMAGLLKSPKNTIKILGKGSLSKKLNISAHSASATAKAAIEKAGGTLTMLS